LFAGGIERHRTVDVSEIRTIENVVGFPSQLNRTILSQTEILEERNIAVKDRRKSN
jgi:hypothetical protein